VPKLIAAGRHFGWDLFQPYPSGAEAHHLNFRRYPKMPLAPPKATPARPSRVSSAGLALVASFEGLRLAPYQDVAGVWTIGYGHTLDVVPETHKLASASAAKMLLRTDLTIYASAVRRLVRAPLTQRQFDALVSLAYNIGIGAFEGSTLRKQLNAEHYARAANQFLVWNRAGGKVQPGLVARRKPSGRCSWPGRIAGPRSSQGRESNEEAPSRDRRSRGRNRRDRRGRHRPPVGGDRHRLRGLRARRRDLHRRARRRARCPGNHLEGEQVMGLEWLLILVVLVLLIVFLARRA
jgi:lysozyme